MKALVLALVGVAVGLLIAGVPPIVFDDRTVLAAPPEARAEGFVRALMAKRPGIAVRSLSRSEPPAADARTLASRFAALEEEIGGIRNVDPEAVYVGREHSRVRLTLEGRRPVRLPIEFEMRWERGSWRIAGLPPRLAD
jgi:hypothetical protein